MREGLYEKLSDLDTAAVEEIPQIVNNWLQRDLQRKNERCINWSEVLNFMAGNQWIRFSERSYHWEPIPYTDSNRVIDRPVTNHFLRWIIVNVSGFTATPSRIVDPNSDAPQDKTAAQISEIILDYLWNDLDKHDAYLEAAFWAVCTGTVFRKSYKTHTLDYVDIGDGKKAPLKKVDSEIVSPFEMSFDGLPSRWRDVRITMQSTVKKIDDIRRQYCVEEEGYFPKAAEELEPEDIVENPLAMAEGIKNIVDGGGFANMSGNNTASTITDSAVLKEIYIAPSLKYPRGQMLVTAAGQVLFRSTPKQGSPYFYLDGKVWHPYTYYNFQKLPGSLWGIGLGQQLLKIQRRMNTIDALLAYNRKTMAVPMIWAPNGSGISSGSLVGQPGQTVEYTVGPNGAKPERDPGLPLPNQIMEERRMLLEDGNIISLSGDIRSGENPEGVHTVGQLQILTEQQQQSRSKQIEGWEHFISESEQLDLLNFKDCYQAPNKAFVRDIKKYSKDITNIDWDTFVGSDLRDNATIRIERGSTIPRSRILRQDTIIKLLPLNVLGDVVSDPFLHKKFLEEFGLSEMFAEANVDVLFMEKAIEMMLKGIYPPTIQGVHNPDVQLPVLLRYMKHPKFLEAADPVKLLFMRKHQELVAELAQANAVPANSMPMPRPGTASAPKAASGQQAPAPNGPAPQPRPTAGEMADA